MRNRALPGTPIVEVDLARCAPDDARTVLSRITESSGIQKLILDYTQIRDDDLKGLPDLSSLTSLSLVGTQVTDVGMKILENWMTLKELKISRTRVDDDGLRYLEKLDGLRFLTLPHIRGSGLAHIAKMHGLEMIDFSGAHVAPVDLQVLRSLPSLREVRFNCHGECDAFVAEISHLQELRRLSIYGPISDQSLKEITGLKNIQVLVLHSSLRSGISGNGLRQLRSLDRLEDLTFDIGKFGEDEMVAIGELVRLRALRLSGPITDTGVSHLRDLRSLRTLDLCETELTDSGLRSLENMVDLENLDLTNADITNSGMAILASHSRLQSLNLAGTAVNNLGLATISQLDGLRDFSTTGATDKGLAVIGKLKNLRSLDLSGSRVSDLGLSHLEKLAELQSLNVSGTSVSDAGVESLSTMSGLDRLDVRNTKLTLAGAHRLHKLMPFADIRGP